MRRGCPGSPGALSATMAVSPLACIGSQVTCRGQDPAAGLASAVKRTYRLTLYRGGVENCRFRTTCDTAATMNYQERNKLRADAKRRRRLPREALRMAQELGLNPRSLLHNVPSPQELWEDTGRGLGAPHVRQ